VTQRAQGDVVGVAVDVQLGCLSFYVNNVPVVRDTDAEGAAKKGKGKFASSYMISSPGTTRFRPAVYMYSPRAGKMAQVPACFSAWLCSLLCFLSAETVLQVTFDFTLLGGVPLPLHEPLSRYG
jgi:hypothetical protein